MKGIVLIVIAIIIFYYREYIGVIFKYLLWKKEICNIHQYDEVVMQELLLDLAKEVFPFHGEDVPHGRTKHFIQANEEFCSISDFDNIEYYGFAPIRSKDELEFIEYGMLLTQNGIYVTWQLNEKDKEDNYGHISKYCPFKGLWNIEYDREKSVLKFYYGSGKIVGIPTKEHNVNESSLVILIKRMIGTGYTNDLNTGFVQSKIDETIINAKNQHVSEEMMGAHIGALAAIYANMPAYLKNVQINSIVNNPQGHGHAAEYVNNLADQIRHPFLKVEQVGQNNAKNGADRIVGNTKIQTKYLSSARNTINSAFDKSEKGGLYKYKGMQLEVPKDQYLESLELMKKKIAEGKVPGVTNPEDAKYIIRKGRITWNESKLIAKGGNVVSLKYDALSGMVQSLPMAGISFVIIFAQAKWSGEDTKEAAIVAAKSGLKTWGMGTIVYTGSQQVAKIFTHKIAETTGKKIAANTVARYTSTVLSFGIIITPSVMNSVSGRISKQQLLKNVAVAGGGFAAGFASTTAAGAALGSIVPGAGTAVGATVGMVSGILGGVAGTVATKKVMDMFIEDDRKEMFAVLKEEFLDVIIALSLSQEEFNSIQLLVFDKKLESKLRDMFKEGKKGNSRRYAREEIVEYSVEIVIKERPLISEKEVISGIESLEIN